MKNKKYVTRWLLIAFVIFLLWIAARGLWQVFVIAFIILLLMIGFGVCAAAGEADRKIEELFKNQKTSQNETTKRSKTNQETNMTTKTITLRQTQGENGNGIQKVNDKEDKGWLKK